MATPPVFTAGAVLTAAQMNAVGMWKTASGTITNAGTLGTNVPNVFSTDFTRFQMVFSNVISSQSGVAVACQFSTGGSASAVQYYFGGQYVLFAGGGANTQGNNTTNFTINAASTAPRSGANFIVINPNVAVHTTFFGQKQNFDAYETVGGIHQVNAAYDGFRVATNVGTVTFDYAIYGLRS